MKKILCAGSALLLAASTLPAFAQEPQQELRPYLSGGYTYTFEDKDRHSDNGNGAFVGVGGAINRWWGWEVSGFGDWFDDDGPSDPGRWRQYGGKVDGLFFYSRNPIFSPYVGLGVGALHSELRNTGDKSTDPFVDFGVGFMKYFQGFADDRVGMRADVRYRWVDADGIPASNTKFGEPVVKVGLVVALGDKPKPVETPVGDADGDGVPDNVDLCPGTPKGVKVDAKGCPLDSDGDGVPDGLDQCPGTPPGVAVDDKGCPTTLGSGRFKITGSGADLRFEDVHFEFDKSELSDYGKEMLDDAASVILEVSKRYPGLKVDISGHTDSVGTEGYNQGLSERRANTVKNYLERKGIPASRLNIYAYGESKPTATNDTVEGRAQNRRAETRTRGE